MPQFRASKPRDQYIFLQRYGTAIPREESQIANFQDTITTRWHTILPTEIADKTLYRAMSER